VLKVQDPLTPLGILSDKYWKDKERKYGDSGRFYLRHMEPSCEICTDDVDNPQLVLFLPYLHWSEHQTQQNQADALQYYHEASDDIKREYEMSKKRSSDMRLQSCALGGELPHHPRRTLDQFYYRNINTQDRDRDQIVLHKTEDPKKVLMVDQLWVVVTSVDTLFTFFPRNYFDKPNGFADLRNSIVEKMKETNSLCHDAFEMAGLCILRAVNVLLNPPSITDDDLNVFRLFQLTIEETKESAVKALNEFIAADHSDPDNLSVKKELNLLRTVADMEDELEILRHLFYEQERVIKGFLTVIQEHGIHQRRGVTAAERALADVREFDEEAKRIWDNAHSIREQLSYLLSLKQTTANLEEARGSRTMQKDTAEQGRTMMIFTVFTVVFLPLSFFTSLYGMNLREWTGEEKNISARSAGLLMGLISAFVIAFALVAAFWGKRVKDFFMKRWNGGKKPDGTDVEMQDHWNLMNSRRS
jgi:Mg2+ and Co2+ transporter CorA